MTDLEPFIRTQLDSLTPLPEGSRSDWADVLRRSGHRQRRSRRRLLLGRAGAQPPRQINRFATRRRLILAAVVLAAATAPLIALGAESNWWFLSGHAPTPIGAPEVVKEGEWNGHPWQLIAYRSGSNGLCISMTPKGSNANGEGAAMNCSPFAGIANGSDTKPSPNMTITYLSGSATTELPAYVVGPVIDNASEVEIRFPNGEGLRVPTFADGRALQHVRFYAAPVPATIAASLPPTYVAGFDRNGKLVACLAPRTAQDGISSLDECK